MKNRSSESSRSADPSLTEVLQDLKQGDVSAPERLLEMVYGDMRRMAVYKMGQLPPGQTLQPTALVHEAYIKLVGGDPAFEGRAHFFGAAARAMRNILVDLARQKGSERHGGELRRVDLLDRVELGDGAASQAGVDRVLDIDQALKELEREDPRAALLVELRFFAGMTEVEAADALEVSERTVRRDWGVRESMVASRPLSGWPFPGHTDRPRVGEGAGFRPRCSLS